jgi:DnaJ-class molecular chaperone
MIEDPYSILGLNSNATKEQVRAKYKRLAIENHPDKLGCDASPEERQRREEYFKRVTVAYHMIMEQRADNTTAFDWKDVWKRVAQKNIWSTFVDVAHTYIRRKVHHVNVPIHMSDVRRGRMKKVQLFLKHVDQPVRVEIDCDLFPHTVLQHEAHDGSYHTIHVHMALQPHAVFWVDEDENLCAFVRIDISSYIRGCVRIIDYIDGSTVEVTIPPFHDLDTDIIVHGYGLRKNKDLFVEIGIYGYTQTQWNSLTEDDKEKLLQLVEKIK